MDNTFFAVIWYEIAQDYRYGCYSFADNCHITNIDEFMGYMTENVCSTNFSVIYAKQIFSQDEMISEFQRAERLYR